MNGNSTAMNGDPQIDPAAVQQPAEGVAPLLVGAEEMAAR